MNRIARTGFQIVIAMLALTLLGCESTGSKGTKHGLPTSHGKSAAQGMFTPTEMKWEAAPPSLPAGAQVAYLEGDPTREGPFTMRLKFPDKYVVPPHSHPNIEHATIIAGTLHMGMGDRYDPAKTRPLTTGSFSYMPPGMTHFAYCTGETIVQLHAEGPWGITYVNPADDPRKNAEKPDAK